MQTVQTLELLELAVYYRFKTVSLHRLMEKRVRFPMEGHIFP